MTFSLSGVSIWWGSQGQWWRIILSSKTSPTSFRTISSLLTTSTTCSIWFCCLAISLLFVSFSCCRAESFLGVPFSDMMVTSVAESWNYQFKIPFKITYLTDYFHSLNYLHLSTTFSSTIFVFFIMWSQIKNCFLLHWSSLNGDITNQNMLGTCRFLYPHTNPVVSCLLSGASLSRVQWYYVMMWVGSRQCTQNIVFWKFQGSLKLWCDTYFEIMNTFAVMDFTTNS